jgi:hypothetical protein
MLLALHSAANDTWEYALKQERPVVTRVVETEPINKAEFVRAKHGRNEFAVNEKDFGRFERDDKTLDDRLCMNVQSGDVAETLRLLVLGADPNYFHAVGVAP